MSPPDCDKIFSRFWTIDEKSWQRSPLYPDPLVLLNNIFEINLFVFGQLMKKAPPDIDP